MALKRSLFEFRKVRVNAKHSIRILVLGWLKQEDQRCVPFGLRTTDNRRKPLPCANHKDVKLGNLHFGIRHVELKAEPDWPIDAASFLSPEYDRLRVKQSVQLLNAFSSCSIAEILHPMRSNAAQFFSTLFFVYDLHAINA